MNKEELIEYRETTNLFNKLFIKEWSGRMQTHNINLILDDIPRNQWVLIKIHSK